MSKISRTELFSPHYYQGRLKNIIMKTHQNLKINKGNEAIMKKVMKKKESFQYTISLLIKVSNYFIFH